MVTPAAQRKGRRQTAALVRRRCGLHKSTSSGYARCPEAPPCRTALIAQGLAFAIALATCSDLIGVLLLLSVVNVVVAQLVRLLSIRDDMQPVAKLLLFEVLLREVLQVAL